uniref:Endoplasmic reticulumGolgi intermediate compartment protein putative n=1 Tax=Albugo laibachii Nc14 TaxID=890382 RepID=F0WY90_9STRA|nr:endoplasmic reticulumGolgi intermediate compartment protein putative [Albugo laibachii Nc14]|eukprot:CCA26442.1 endoplasmic reticulumGolgi intermediate compartment protein putative [Albugo laibachii Nc14]
MMLRQRTLNEKDDSLSQADTSKNEIASKTKRTLKRFDVYPKLHTEFKVQTETGAIVSIITAVIALILFLAELREYMSVRMHEHMVVDSTISEKLRINIDISYLALTCKESYLTAMDVTGELQMDLHRSIGMTRLDAKGNPINTLDSAKEEVLPANYCGSCYETVHPLGKTCCNTCDEVKEAFVANDLRLFDADQKEQCVREMTEEQRQAQAGEGCRLKGYMMVNRVAGNFHVGLGRTFHRKGKLIHQFLPGQESVFNASFLLHSLSFGTPYANVKNGLDGTQYITKKKGGVMKYFLKIVPTIYSDISSSVHSYQYSHTKQEKYMNAMGQISGLPGAYFMFEFSPFMVKIDSEQIPFTHFVIRIFAILGGMISIAGFVDSVIFHFFYRRNKSSPVASKHSKK